MAIRRTRKTKQTVNYGFLYSWDNSKSNVKRDLERNREVNNSKAIYKKSADILAQDRTTVNVKADIIKSLIIISLIIVLEAVVYLAWSSFIK